MPACQSYRGPVVRKRADAEPGARPPRQTGHHSTRRRRGESKNAGLPRAVRLSFVSEPCDEARDALTLVIAPSSVLHAGELAVKVEMAPAVAPCNCKRVHSPVSRVASVGSAPWSTDR